MQTIFIIWDTTHEGWLHAIKTGGTTCLVERTLDIAQATGFTNSIQPTTPNAERIARSVVIVSVSIAGALMLLTCLVGMLVTLADYKRKTAK